MGTMETLANVQLVRFQGFSEDLWTSQTFPLKRPGHEGSGTHSPSSAAQLGMAHH